MSAEDGRELPPSPPGAPPLPPRAEVTPGKVKGAREALDRWGLVQFRNGAAIRRRSNGSLEVTRFPGNALRGERFFLARYLDRAYDYALNGPTDAEREADRRRRVPPFWYRPKPIPTPHPEWDECPF